MRFPFGFGLSYTSFEFSEFSADEHGARVTVTNSGEVAGAEVVQCYVGRVGEVGVIRPKRELKAFTKVHLDPGESATVELSFDDRTFAHFATATDSWEVETGAYRVEIARNASEVVLSSEVSVSGTVEPDPAATAGLPHYVAGDIPAVTDAEFEVLLGRAIPAPNKGEFGVNDPLQNMVSARNPIARLAARILQDRLAKSEASGHPDLNLLFVTSMPLRAVAKMTNGMVNMPMVYALQRIVNGHFFSGFGQLVAAWWRGRRDAKQLADQFDKATKE